MTKQEEPSYEDCAKAVSSGHNLAKKHLVMERLMAEKPTKQKEIREGLRWQITQVAENSEQIRDVVLEYLHSQGIVIKVERELPKELTNNIGCMSKAEIEDFATMVLKECDYPYTMKWTTAGDIVIEPFIYIDERHINEYPYMAKERVLHEVAHIDTHPQDDRHGELFHRRYAELVNRFLAGYVAVEPLIEE